MNLWEKYNDCFIENASKKALVINDISYTYSEFCEYISGCQQQLKKKTGNQTGIPVGVYCHDRIETFAAIFAIWFSGCYFVPLNPLQPAILNNEKIERAEVNIIFNSEEEEISEKKAGHICSNGLKSNNSISISKETGRAYVLFTSGSTGTPKAVPVSTQSMNAFIDGFTALYPDLSDNDRFLQTYDLTSDAAFTGYLIPLLIGASVYTIPSGAIKYLTIIKYIQKYNITWTQFTPSVLNYLKPYLRSIKLPSLKHSHFGGEALPIGLTTEWARCVPNAEISNIYGPTETTITCTIYRSNINDIEKHVHNEVVSIGKPLLDVKTVIVDENDRLLGKNQKGELCIGGIQVMEGYLNDSPINEKVFLFQQENEDNHKYYRSGDIVFEDESGYLYYCGRKDDQLKISGYRIEPGEIEVAISKVTDGCKSKVYGFTSSSGLTAIIAFVEKKEIDPTRIKEALKALLPLPLIPEKVIGIPCFPLNTAGKVDKNALFDQHL